MMILRGFILLLCIFVLGLGGLSLVAQEKKGIDQARDNSPADSLTIKIKTYEDIVAELQQRPFENQSLAHIMTQLGNLYSASEDYPKAIYVYMQSILLRQYSIDGQGEKQSDLAWQIIEIGNSFYRLKDYKLAEQAFRSAANMFISAHDHSGLITSVNNIGLCRYHSGQYQAALPVFEKMLEYSKRINDVGRIYSSTIYIGMSYGALKQYHKAISRLKALEKYTLRKDDLDLEEFRIYQLGEIYMQSGDTAKTISTYQLLTGTPLDPADTYYNSLVMSRLAQFYFTNGKFAEAKVHALEAYRQLKNQHHLALLNEINHLLYRIYRKQGDQNSAIKHLEEHVEGISSLNQREINAFISDYNKKMERIAISQELQRMREQNIRMNTEKSNQQSLSVFLVIIAILLLVMLFTAKGFDSRIQLLLDHIKGYTPYQKTWLLLLLGLYFIGFYYFFVPVDSALEIKQRSFASRLLPGLLAYGVTLFVMIMFYSGMALRKPIRNWYVYSLYFFGTAFTAVLLAQFAHFHVIGFGSLNFLLSLSLIVLASFIVPLYLFIVVVEKLIVKHIESISQALNRDIDQIRQKASVPEIKPITIHSEKTSGKVSFDLNSFVSVEAQGNYCMFYLRQHDVLSKKMLHITMKSIEENLAGHEFIIRCHKSFLVNIHHITKVSGNSRGYFLHFGDEIEPVPVSRGFQKDVMGLIRKIKDDIS